MTVETHLYYHMHACVQMYTHLLHIPKLDIKRMLMSHRQGHSSKWLHKVVWTWTTKILPHSMYCPFSGTTFAFNEMEVYSFVDLQMFWLSKGCPGTSVPMHSWGRKPQPGLFPGRAGREVTQPQDLLLPGTSPSGKHPASIRIEEICF